MLAAVVMMGGLIAQAEDAAPAVSLKYKFAVGDTARYKVVQRWSGTRILPGASAPTAIDAEETSLVRLDCKKVWEDGYTDVDFSTEAGSLKVEGRPSPNYQVPKNVYTLAVTPLRVLGVPADYASVQSIVFAGVFLKRPVQIGDSWYTQNPIPSAWPSKLRVTYTYDGLRDGRVAVLKIRISTVTPPGNDGKVISPGSTQEGQGILLFDVDKGRVQSVNGTLSTSVTMAESADAAKKGISTKITVRTEFSSELLQSDASAAPANAAK